MPYCFHFRCIGTFFFLILLTGFIKNSHKSEQRATARMRIEGKVTPILKTNAGTRGGTHIYGKTYGTPL